MIKSIQDDILHGNKLNFKIDDIAEEINMRDYEVLDYLS